MRFTLSAVFLLILAIIAVVVTQLAVTVAAMTIESRLQLPFSAGAGRIVVDSQRRVALVLVDSPAIFPSDPARYPDSISYALASSVPGYVCRINLTETAGAGVSLSSIAPSTASGCVALTLTADGVSPMAAYDIVLDEVNERAFIVSGSRTAKRGICRIDGYASSGAVAAPVCVQLQGASLGANGAAFGVSLSTAFSSAFVVVAVHHTSDHAYERSVCSVHASNLSVASCDHFVSKSWLPFAVAVDAGGNIFVASIGSWNSVLCRYKMDTATTAAVSFDACVNFFDSCFHGVRLAMVGGGNATPGSAARIYVACETDSDDYSVVFAIRDLVLEAVYLNPTIAGHALGLLPGTSSVFWGSQGVSAKSSALAGDETLSELDAGSLTYIRNKECLNLTATSSPSSSTMTDAARYAAKTVFGIGVDSSTNKAYVVQGNGAIAQVCLNCSSTSGSALVSAATSACVSNCSYVMRNYYVSRFSARSYALTQCGTNFTVPDWERPRFSNYASDNGISAAVVVIGITIGVVVLVLSVIAIVCVCVKRRREEEAAAVLPAAMAARTNALLINGVRRVPVVAQVVEATRVAVGYCPLCFEEQALDVAVCVHLAEPTAMSSATAAAANRGGDNDDVAGQEMEERDPGQQSAGFTPIGTENSRSPDQGDARPQFKTPTTAASSAAVSIPAGDGVLPANLTDHKMCKSCRDRWSSTPHADECPWCRGKILVAASPKVVV